MADTFRKNNMATNVCMRFSIFRSFECDDMSTLTENPSEDTNGRIEAENAGAALP